MTTETFRAAVQYGDFRGTAAADRSDKHGLHEYLTSNRLIAQGEFLVGIDFFSGEVHSAEQNAPIVVTALIARLDGFDTVKDAVASGAPLKVRRIKLDLSLPKFFGMFKRFSVSISASGLLTDRHYSYED